MKSLKKSNYTFKNFSIHLKKNILNSFFHQNFNKDIFINIPESSFIYKKEDLFAFSYSLLEKDFLFFFNTKSNALIIISNSAILITDEYQNIQTNSVIKNHFFYPSISFLSRNFDRFLNISDVKGDPILDKFYKTLISYSFNENKNDLILIKGEVQYESSDKKNYYNYFSEKSKSYYSLYKTPTFS